MRRNRGHRRRSHRRNPLVIRRNGLSSALSKIPLIGAPLAAAASFLAPTGFAAVAVWPALMLTKLLANVPMLADLSTSIFYPVLGLVAGGAIAAAPIPYISKETRMQFAIGIASAGGAIGSYKWLTGTDGDVASEAGALQMSGFGSFAEGFATRVVPMAGYMYAR